MSYTNEDYLPSFEELTVPEIQLTSAVLQAGAHQYGKYCDDTNKEFMLCISETKDPRKCLSEGKEVTKCGFEFFGKVKRDCHEEFTKYWKCVDVSGTTMELKGCREFQSIFDNCIKEKLGQDRPPLGYFSKIRVHESKRPKPPPLPHPLPDALPEPPSLDKAPEPNMHPYNPQL
ncbi:hypothetical protein SNE40_010741 [Patella caerulea]|uniref:NADH dehydrogenase [ubiquinone] 1 alpha subcomplex subunit 8 n=1 Tax=Patella caerulea TaxID=87958 RepID=A0AAN8K1L6_PATCE